tara:strand:- start:313585 stop:314802 length:1218 start_codon:yes stop_codon:yes gene_type:complete
MVFWRKKKSSEQESVKEDALLHPEGEPTLEPVAETPTAQDVEETVHDIEAAQDTPIAEIAETPVPEAVTETVSDVVIEEAVQVSAEASGAPDAEEEQEGGWFSRLSGGLTKSSQKIGQGIGDLITKKKLDHETLEALEDILITADLGPELAIRLVSELEKDRFGKDISDEEIKIYLADKITEILAPCTSQLEMKKPEKGPRVILVCGVNGVGKTTTIGKLAHQMHFKAGKKVAMGAGDTFRAAAVEQLQIWAERTGSAFVSKDIGSDAAAVAYESYQKALDENADILMIDTAGRLHNKQNLMAELEKIIRVLKKHDENLPHEVLLVLDATTGQNAITQVEVFKSLVNVTGLIVTKLDGSAKGGVVVALAEQFKLPVYAVGVGESVEDLQAFKPEDYAKALVGLGE